jgi:hypothetical protein
MDSMAWPTTVRHLSLHSLWYSPRSRIVFAAALIRGSTGYPTVRNVNIPFCDLNVIRREDVRSDRHIPDSDLIWIGAGGDSHEHRAFWPNTRQEQAGRELAH